MAYKLRTAGISQIVDPGTMGHRNGYNRSIRRTGHSTLSSTSPSINKFVGVGCDIFFFIANSYHKNYSTGCVALCSGTDSSNTISPQNMSVMLPDIELPAFLVQSCSGSRCCQAPLPLGLKSFYVRMFNVRSGSSDRNSQMCAWAFITEQNNHDPFVSFEEEIPMTLNWVMGNTSCEDEEVNYSSSKYACGNHAKCSNYGHGQGYRCECIHGCQGNPYLPNGCQAIDWCKKVKNHTCEEGAECKNTPGGPYGSCLRRYHKYGAKGNLCTPYKQTRSLVLITFLGDLPSSKMGHYIDDKIQNRKGKEKQRLPLRFSS